MSLRGDSNSDSRKRENACNLSLNIGGTLAGNGSRRPRSRCSRCRAYPCKGACCRGRHVVDNVALLPCPGRRRGCAELPPTNRTQASPGAAVIRSADQESSPEPLVLIAVSGVVRIASAHPGFNRGAHDGSRDKVPCIG